MKNNRIKKTLFSFFLVVPFVFSILFFGYLPPKFTIVLHTDHVVGEGYVVTSLSSRESFSPFYQRGFYCGSILKKATINDIHYNVKRLDLSFSDVEELNLESYDLVILGKTVASYDLTDRFTPGEYGGMTLSLPEDGTGMHIVFSDPDAGDNLGLNTHFAPWWYWVAYALLVVLVSALLAFGMSYVADRFPILLWLLLCASALMVTTLTGCFFCGSFPYVNYTDFLLGFLLIFSAGLLVNALTLPFLGTLLTMGFTTIWYIANYYVISFRNKPIMPADLKAIGTAAEVMGSYSFLPSWKMILGVLVVAAYGIAVVLLWKKTKPKEKRPVKKQLLRRGVAAIISVLLMIGVLNSGTFKSLNTFAWDAVLLKSFHEEGMVLTYLKNSFNGGVKKPEGYSGEILNNWLSEYETEETDGACPTRIIMVMNEAFSDLRTVGLDERIDVMPFIDGLDKNVIEGSLYVSVFGGGTCNSEFEALTGNTLAFLGTGAYPYTENVTEPLFSLASYFRELGYDTEAFHANEAQNWNRNMVYPNLGFDDFHDIHEYAEFGDITYLHDHPADITDYRYMDSIAEMKQGCPCFLFNVTMQNHSGYISWENVERDPSVEEYGSELYLDTQIYLSLVKASDEAVRQLVETYRNSDEPTMIIFFGDHQPGLPAIAQREFYDVDSYLDFYKTKFFIWTNYETNTIHNMKISANYLPYLILERGNFPLPPYVQLLREVHEKYPVISAMGIMDAEGNIYGSVNDLMDDPMIRKYQYVQYANLFDVIDSAWFAVE